MFAVQPALLRAREPVPLRSQLAVLEAPALT
jgi:hypothetical protein